MRIAAFTFTRDRLEYTRRTLESMRAAQPGYHYDHYVYDMGSVDGTVDWLDGEVRAGHITAYTAFGENLGHHVGSNRVHAELLARGYDALLRVDNDIEFKTKRWLKKLVRAHDALGKKAVVSPRILGLNNPPPSFASKSIDGMRFAFVEILGGACRFMPAEIVREFRFNERMPLAIGEAASLATWLVNRTLPMAYADDILVRHMDTTSGQEQALPEYFKRSFFERHMPYGM